jgi:hypothetical protein
LIQIDEIVELVNLEVKTPQGGSLGEFLSHPYIVIELGRESAPKPLCKLINIYDDVESSKIPWLLLCGSQNKRIPRRNLLQLPTLKIRAFHIMTKRSKVS